jgi:transposase
MAVRASTPSFILELPLATSSKSAKQLRSRLEAARNLYNVCLGEAKRRLNAMRNSPEWQAAQAVSKGDKYKAERRAAYSLARTTYHFSEYDLHHYVATIRKHWLRELVDSATAQKLASRAFEAVNKLCFGQARRVRFKTKSRGLDSVEGKSNTSGIRFILDAPTQGNTGRLGWGKDLTVSAIIDWQDEVVRHGLACPIKYVRVVRRKATSPKAKGADCEGYRYYVQLILQGVPYQKPKNVAGTAILGTDIGPQTIGIVSQDAEVARLDVFCAELEPDVKAKKKLQRKADRQRRANNPQNFDEKGRIKKLGATTGQKGPLVWKQSNSYKETMRKLAVIDRKLAAHRKSLHGKLANEIIRAGNDISTEKLSYKAFQKLYGKSVGLRAPGMFVEILRRKVANTCGKLTEFGTYHTRLSQTCHRCGNIAKKKLSERWHKCKVCGLGPVQRDLYSAWLASHIDPVEQTLSLDQHFLLSGECWQGVEMRLSTAMDRLKERAKEGYLLPRSVGLGASTRVRWYKSLEGN